MKIKAKNGTLERIPGGLDGKLVANLMAGKEVSAVQRYNVVVKLVPADRSSAGKEVRAVQPFHV